MKLLGIIGSLMVFFYVVGVLGLTWHNVSRWLFTLEEPNKDKPATRFWMRQFMILIWPLVLPSREGRRALRVIWTGVDDRELTYDIEGDGFQTLNQRPRTSNRRKD
jgi:hypothetical protein